MPYRAVRGVRGALEASSTCLQGARPQPPRWPPRPAAPRTRRPMVGTFHPLAPSLGPVPRPRPRGVTVPSRPTSRRRPALPCTPGFSKGLAEPLGGLEALGLHPPRLRPAHLLALPVGPMGESPGWGGSTGLRGYSSVGLAAFSGPHSVPCPRLAPSLLLSVPMGFQPQRPWPEGREGSGMPPPLLPAGLQSLCLSGLPCLSGRVPRRAPAGI